MTTPPRPSAPSWTPPRRGGGAAARSRRSEEGSAPRASRRGPKPRSRLGGELVRRVLASLVAAGFAGAGVAALDARWAHKTQEGLGFAALFAAAFGTTAPLAACFAMAIGIGSFLVHPRVAPTVGALLERLRHLGSGRPADIAAFVPLTVFGAFVWTTLVAQLGRAVMSLDAPSKLVGSALLFGSIVALGIVALGVFASTPTVRRIVALGQPHARWLVDPVVTGALALVLVVAFVTYGSYHGTVSGEGGVLGIYGILQRPELDLRALGAWLAFGVVVYFAPAFLHEFPTPAALVIALLPLVLTVREGRALERNLELARGLERGAPVAKVPLALLRKLGDRDHDGASAWFGGGDCDDTNRAVGPAAEDVPDNGIDEDCSGSDLTLGEPESQKAAPVLAKTALERLPKRSNLVLITVDTLRADLGYAGYKRAVSPNLDALAKRSTVFERAYSLASYTGKSIGPMLIGKYGSETHRNWGHFNKFGNEDTFLAERVRAAGIRTVSVHAHRYFGAFGGLDRGFDTVDMSAAPPEGASWATDQTATSEKLTDAALTQLKTVGADQRFLLWVHYLDPHADYLSHSDVPSFGRAPRDQYDHEVAHTDKHIGRLLDFIAAQPWGERTNIIVTSDHGEAFGEHGMMRHGFELWEPLVHVPLLIHVPGLQPTRVSERRSAVDLVPTVLELLGAPPAPARDAAPAGSTDFVSGQSLVADMLRDEGAPATPRDILIDMPAGPYNEARRALIHEDLKLILSRDASKELFDLATDPTESKDVWASRKKDIEAPYARAKGRLRAFDVKAP